MPELSDMPASAAGWRLEHSYASLPSSFYERVAPTPVRAPQRVVLNEPLAAALGLKLEGLQDAALWTGNAWPPGAEPLAQAYAGHQYAHFTMLGDGRAILLGEQISPTGQRFDIQLKGAGPTPFSRRGDGRAALGPMLREYIISEAMHALGIPTTRSLAVATTGEPVWRQDGALPGAVLTRVAASHIRVGTFEYAAARRDVQALAALATYTRKRHYPEIGDSHQALYEAVLERQARLLAQWMHVGFIHGVMNTDNMALSGETIDYGPCAFMDAYDPATVFSSIDRHGRYAYGQQPHIAQWNLARLAEAMLPLFHADEKQAVELANGLMERFEGRYKHHWLAGMRAKLGLFNEEAEDAALIQALLDWMQETKADYTNTFRELTRGLGGPPEWQPQWAARRQRQPQTAQEVTALMQRSNPAFIPRNHKVEEALAAATAHGDLNPMQRLLTVLTAPFDHTQDWPEFSQPADDMPGYRTFCGT